jgi:hypothetical protein
MHSMGKRWHEHTGETTLSYSDRVVTLKLSPRSRKFAEEQELDLFPLTGQDQFGYSSKIRGTRGRRLPRKSRHGWDQTVEASLEDTVETSVFVDKDAHAPIYREPVANAGGFAHSRLACTDKQPLLTVAKRIQRRGLCNQSTSLNSPFVYKQNRARRENALQNRIDFETIAPTERLSMPRRKHTPIAETQFHVGMQDTYDLSTLSFMNSYYKSAGSGTGAGAGGGLAGPLK